MLKSGLRLFFCILILAFIISGWFLFNNKKSGIDFNYVAINCKIYSINGKVVYNNQSIMCSFKDDGQVLTHQPALLNRDDQLIWSSDELVHHSTKFSDDQKSLLFIEAEKIDFNGLPVKSDCFSKRTLNNKILNRWCLSQHIKELEEMGVRFVAVPVLKYQLHNNYFKYEISHSNSIYEIPDNGNSQKSEAFKKGNFLINIYGESRTLLILNPDMTKILWVKNLESFEWADHRNHLCYPLAKDHCVFNYATVEPHDSQVMEDGTILTYATLKEDTSSAKLKLNLNSQYKPDNVCLFTDNSKTTVRNRTYIIRWDPLNSAENFKVVWYGNQSKSTDTPIGGQVTLLKNGNYLLTETSDEGSQLIMVSSAGELLWTFPYVKEYEGQKVQFMNAKPLYNESFLSARELL